MKRKLTRLHDDEDTYDLDKPYLPDLQVDGLPDPVDTGLVDEDGNAIFRDAIEPIGFLSFE